MILNLQYLMYIFKNNFFDKSIKLENVKKRLL